MRPAFFSLFILLNSLPTHAADSSCAKAMVLSGTNCRYLNVQFDFSTCPGGAPNPVSGETVHCESARPAAIAQQAGGTYEAELKPPATADDSWSVVKVSLRNGKAKEKAAPAPKAAAPPPPATAPPAPQVAATAVSPPISALAIASPPPSNPTASNLANIKVNGHFRARYESSNHTNFVNERDFMLMRVRPAFTYPVNSNVIIVLEPQFARTFGENALPPGSATPATASGATVDPDFSVHQGFGEYKIMALDFKVGRQVLSYGDELVIGALDWNNVGRAFDALKARYTYSWGWVDAFASKISETNATSAGPGDKDFYGLYSSMDFGPYLSNFDFYALYSKDSTVASPLKIGTFGLRAKSKVGNLLYRLEADTQWEQSAGKDAYQADVEIGWQFSSFYKTMISGEVFRTGRDYSQMYPTAHKWLGYADVFGRRNISGAVLHLASSFTPVVSTQLDYHYFQRTSDSAAPVKLDGSAAIGNPTASHSKELGSEIDLTVNYDVLDGLTATGGYSILFMDDYLTNQFNYTNVSFVFLQLMTKF